MPELANSVQAASATLHAKTVATASPTTIRRGEERGGDRPSAEKKGKKDEMLEEKSRRARALMCGPVGRRESASSVNYRHCANDLVG